MCHINLPDMHCNLIDKEFIQNFIIAIISTAIALTAGIITFIKQKKIDRRKKQEQNETIFRYYKIFLDRIIVSIPQEKIYYKTFIEHVNTKWDSQPILNILGLEDKKRFHSEINQVELFKAVSEYIQPNPGIIKNYYNIYTLVDSYKVQSDLIINEIQKGINENLILRKDFLQQKREMQNSLFIHLKRLPEIELDSFHALLKVFYEKDLSQSGFINISKFYYESIIPIMNEIERNLNYNIATDILTIINKMTCIIIDLKTISNEMANFVTEYVTELDLVEAQFITETREIFKYGT